MLSRQDNGFYTIAEDEYDKYPVVVNKELMDNSIQELLSHFQTLLHTIKKLYDEHDDVYNVLMYNIYYLENSLEIDEGIPMVIDRIIDELSSLKLKLDTYQDYIKTKDELWTLEDEGFRCTYFTDDFLQYEKVTEDTDEREVVEEILTTSPILYRKRTIEWELTSYGKHSKSITYEDLPLTTELKQYISNTVSRNEV